MNTDATASTLPSAGGASPRRPVGVLLAAVVLGLMACFGLLTSVGMFFGALMVKTVRAELPPSVEAFEMVTGVITLLISIFLGFVVVGLFRMKQWARICILIIGGLVAFFSFFNVVIDVALSFMASSFIPRQPAAQVPPEVFRLMFLGTAVVSLLVALVGVWWLVYFNLRGVRTLFAKRPVLDTQVTQPNPEVPSMTATTEGVWIHPGAPVKPGKGAVEILIIVLAVLYLLGFAEMIVAIFVHLPIFLFGYIARGATADAGFLLFSVLNIAIGVGLLRRVKAAWAGAMFFNGLGLLSGLCLLLPGNRAALLSIQQEMTRKLFGGTIPSVTGSPVAFIQGPILVISAVLGVVVAGLVFWLLIKARPLFEVKTPSR